MNSRLAVQYHEVRPGVFPRSEPGQDLGLRHCPAKPAISGRCCMCMRLWVRKLSRGNDASYSDHERCQALPHVALSPLASAHSDGHCCTRTATYKVHCRIWKGGTTNLLRCLK